MRRVAMVSPALLLLAAPAMAQDVTAGRVATSSVGQVGDRQTRAQAGPNINPIARVDGRIQNRVQSRIRNRIDRYYGPQANAASPFAVAGDQLRAASRPRR